MGDDLAGLSTSGAQVLMLGRKELQRLAKKHGIKANLSSDAIVDRLLELRAKAARAVAAEDSADGQARGPASAALLGVGAGADAHAGSSTVSDLLPLGPRAAPTGDRTERSSLPPSPSAQLADASCSRAAPSEEVALSRASPPPVVPCARTPSFSDAGQRQAGAPAAPPSSELAEAGARPRSATPTPLARKRSEGLAHSPAARPGTAVAPGSSAGGGPDCSSVAKRKSPGFMAPLRRHSGVEGGALLKRHSTGAHRTPGRTAGEREDKERSGDKENGSCAIPGVDPALAKSILQEVVLPSNGVSWDDIGAPRLAAALGWRFHAPASPHHPPLCSPTPPLRLPRPAQPAWRRRRPRCARL